MITTALLPPRQRITSLVYFPLEGTLYIVQVHVCYLCWCIYVHVHVHVQLKLHVSDLVQFYFSASSDAVNITG